MIKNLISNRAIIWALAKRDLKTRYVGSAAGFVWAFVQPAMMILVFTVVFGTLLGSSFGAGDSVRDFAFYLCAGLLPWNAFQEILSRTPIVYLEHASLIKKLPIKLEILPAQSIVATLISLGVNIAVLFVVMIIMGQYPAMEILLLPAAVFLLLLSVIGMAYGLAAITIFYRDMAHFVSVGVFLWFWLTPIVYRPEIMPVWAQKVLWFNPFTHVADLFRLALLGDGGTAYLTLNASDMTGIAYTIGVSGILMTFGFAAFKKLHRKIPENV